MKTLTVSLLLASLFSLPQIAAAAGTNRATASFQVSFVINEACAVDSTSARPVVNCQFNTPYQAAKASDSVATVASANSVASAPRAAQSETSAQGQLWTVTF